MTAGPPSSTGRSGTFAELMRHLNGWRQLLGFVGQFVGVLLRCPEE